MKTELKIKNSCRGFTVVELLISMSVFVIIVGIATGIFIRSLRTQRTTISLMAINDNASLALEQMVREIRVGSGFSAPSSTELRFTNSASQPVVYRWNSSEESLERGANGNFRTLAGGDIKIKKMGFVLSGQLIGDGLATRVTLYLNVGSSLRDLSGITTNIQTTVSVRFEE